jgi:hypothetical protein
MPNNQLPDTGVLVRTLITTGFVVTRATRQPTHIEIYCERMDIFGCVVPYFVALLETSSADLISQVRTIAQQDGRVFLPIAQDNTNGCVPWLAALAAMGGEVPSWRALGAEYKDWLKTTGANELPAGASGEAWQLFEIAVADGLEYLLGRRVLKLGGIARGQRVSDLIARSSDGAVIVVDAKASKNPYGVTMSALRPLIEYVETQRVRQQGLDEVSAALLVANSFEQPPSDLANVGADFLAAARVPLACLQTSTLLKMIELMSISPTSRNKVIWRRVFCRPGLIDEAILAAEVKAANAHSV